MAVLMSKKSKIIYYRPEWTCGRYDKNAHVAIYYNLIVGESHFFEDFSADVMGIFLSLQKNGCISIEELSDITNISEKSLIPFLQQLCQLGLITTFKPCKDDILSYRIKQHKTYNEGRLPIRAKFSDSDYTVEKTDTEAAYESKAGGITNVMFELTYNCSEKCIHCYNIGANRNNNEENHRGKTKNLSIDDYRRIIDELYEEGLTKVLLTGGDPFSYGGIWEVLDYLYQKDIAIDIFTNGIALTGKEERLANYYPHRVCLSLYSGIANDHDEITRVAGSWDKTVSVIDKLAVYSIPMVIKCCVMKPNLKSYYTTSDVGRKYGISVQYELNVTDSIDGDKCVSHYLRLSPEQLEIVLRDPATVMYVGKDVENYGAVFIDKDSNACKAGYHTFTITPDGNLVPCCAFHLIFGNLQQKSLKEIIKGNQTLEWWRNLKIRDYEECGKHKYCSFCNFCVGINHSEHGTPIKAAENNCYMAKVRYNLACKMEQENYDPLQGLSLQEVLNKLPEEKIRVIRRVYTRVENVDK